MLYNLENLDINYENFNRDILFRIPTDKRKINWSEFFKRLDGSLNVLKIKNYSINKSTLEDVFLNLSNIINKIGKDESKEIFELERKNSLINNELLFNPDHYEKNVNYKSKFCKDFKISFKKSILQLIRDKKALILEIICPILLSFIGCLIGYIELLEENKAFPLNINQITNDTQIIYYYDNNYSDFLEQLSFYKTFEDLPNIKYEFLNASSRNNFSSKSERKLLEDIQILYDIKKERKEKSYIFYEPFYINELNHKYGFNAIIDITPRQSAPIYANFLLSNIVKYVIKKYNKTNIEIEMINEPFQYTYEEIKEKKSRNQFLILFFISLSFSLIPSNFITAIIKERENNSKHLQIISGISLFSYWFNNYIFDLIKYYLIGGIIVIILFAFDFYEKYLYILYLEYGPATISFTYLFSVILKSEYTGQISVLLINLIFGVIFSIAVLTMRLYDELINYANKLSYILRIIPSFCFCYGFNQLIRKNELYILDEDISSYYFQNSDLEKEVNKNIISIDHVGADLIYLAVESIAYLIILIILENVLNKNLIKFNIKLDEFENNNDINLQLSQRDTPDKVYAIKVKNLVKIFFNKCCHKIKAVKNISFNLDYGEIFGFLGVNGAGKTTTFKCLSNEIFPTYGNIYIDNYDITKNFNKIRNLIGYCPQFDTIFEYLTVFENLQFYGIIKGAKKEKINDIIEALMKEMNLLEYKNKISGTLSGGNKRKLSVAIALICNPKIILLDEPSTGMDPEARRQLWKTIYNISLNRKQSTIIMTTHSMEEAESLCKKIGILVDGQFKCLGTSDEIKDKFGYGFELNIQIKNPDINKLLENFKLDFKDINNKIYINSFDECLNKYNLNRYKNQFNYNLFGGNLLEELKINGYIPLKKIILWLYDLKCVMSLIKLIKEYFKEIFCVDYKDNNFIFKIKRNREKGEKTIGFLFGLIEDNKDKFNIKQYFLQYSSLEQIFNMFAKKDNFEKNRINIFINEDILDCFCW